MTDHSELIARLLDSSDTTALEAVDAAAAALREQAGEIQQAHEASDKWREIYAQRTAERDTLASENAGLKEALGEYGAHLSGCAWVKGYDVIEGLAWEKCDCGLDDAREPK